MAQPLWDHGPAFENPRRHSISQTDLDLRDEEIRMDVIT